MRGAVGHLSNGGCNEGPIFGDDRAERDIGLENLPIITQAG